MEKSQDVRTAVLQAANERFRNVGYGKTTMAEIAGDCDMSAANLYRFFENKEDIGAAIAARYMSEQEAEGRSVVRQSGLDAGERLEMFVLTLGRSIWKIAVGERFTQELVNVICERRWDLVEGHIGAVRSLIAEILAQGNERGEFDVADISETAATIHVACKAFFAPMMVCHFSEDELEDSARRVVRLLVRGLAKR